METIIAAIIAVVEATLAFVDSYTTKGFAATTERRKILAGNITDFIKLKTTGYKDIIYALIAIATVFGIIFITTYKKKNS